MKPPAHILVIRLSAMGDVAMTVPVLLKLVEAYPDLQLTVISRKLFKPFFDDIPNISFLEADVKGAHKGLVGIVKLAKQAKKQHITAVADLHNVIRTKVMRRYFTSFSIKVAKIDKGRAEKKAITKASGKPLKPIKSTHERYADVFRKLGYALDLQSPLFLKRKPWPAKISEKITSKKRIGIAPFAAYQSKMYPLDLMKEVIQTLEATNEYQMFLFGSLEEKNALETLVLNSNTIINTAGMFSLEEELALISNLDVMVSMDSGNGHLAAMYGIPVITLWGVTHPFTGFVPFHQPMENQLVSDVEKYPLLPTSVYGNKYPTGYENVMESIEPLAVIEKIKKLLD
ncbi:glycosyltransferase family 9 protein [Halomarinibacterium sedimenti]|nr:glycosyltransferase family 9 protein [Halomarinibacterium sedimenti]